MGAVGVEIRPYQEADAPALQAIRAAAFAPIFASFRALVGPEIAEHALATAEAEQAALLSSLCAGNAAGRMLVASEDGAIVGFACFTLDVSPGVGEIGLNAVRPDRQGRGIAGALYAEILDHMRAAGMRCAAVATGGDPSHAPARAAYARAGFAVGLPSVYLYRRLDAAEGRP